MPKIINPSKLSNDDIKNLFIFFEEQKTLGIQRWTQGHAYTFEDKTEFSFAYDVIQRKRKDGKEGVRYEFISSLCVGKGGYSSIYEIDGTLKITSDNILYKQYGYKNKTRVVKIQEHSAAYPLQCVLSEYHFSKQADHLAIKEPVIDGQTSFTVMRKMKGRDLIDIIIDDHSGKHPLSNQQRMDLSKALLKALKEQVTDKGLVHRDIKGENIRVDMTSPDPIQIYDFAFTMPINKPDGTYPGSISYAPPEQFFSERQTEKIDVFSMGRVLALLWRVDKASYMYSDMDLVVYNASHINLDTLFMGIDGLSAENAHQIRSTLQSMLINDSAARITIEEAIEQFSCIELSSDTPGAKLSTAALINALGLPTAQTQAIHQAVFMESKKQIAGILEKISFLKNKVLDLKRINEERTAQHLQDLIARLEIIILSLHAMDKVNYDINIIQSIQECQQLIHINKELFKEQDYHTEPILANMGLALAGLGAIYFAARMVNLALTGNFMFFNERKIDERLDDIAISLGEADSFYTLSLV